MKDFIKENLRIQLENLLYEVKDDFNELPSLIRSKITRVNSKEELIQLSKLAKKLANKYYDTFGGVYDGTGTYTFKITKSGNGFVIKSDMGKDDREYILGQEGKSLRLNAKAYTDQEANLNFKDMMDDENKGKSKFSPIVDAKIKILADDQMIKSIMDFDFEGSYTSSDQLDTNAKASAEKTAAKDMYRFKKLEKDKKNNPNFRRKDVISINEPDKLESREYKDALRKYENLLPLYLEKSNKGEDITAIKATMDGFKAIIDKINPNYGK